MRPNLHVLRSAIGPMFTEAGVLRRSTGRTEQNEETGEEVPVFDVVFEGPVLVRPEGQADVTIGGVEIPQARYEVTLPAEADATVGDLLTLTTCPWQPELVGLPLALTDVPLDAWQVARFCKAERQI